MGYWPETSYEERHQELWISPDEEYVEFAMEHMLEPEEATEENAGKIRAWLMAHANEDGVVRECTDYCYGRIIWDVRKKIDNPNEERMSGGGRYETSRIFDGRKRDRQIDASAAGAGSV